MNGSNFPTSNNNPNSSPLRQSSNNLERVRRTDSTHAPLSEAERRQIRRIPGPNIIMINCGEACPIDNAPNISQVPSLANTSPSQRQFNLFDNLRPNNPERKS